MNWKIVTTACARPRARTRFGVSAASRSALAALLRSKYTPEMQSQKHLVEASRYNFRLLRHRKSLEVTESANCNRCIGIGRLLPPPAHAPTPDLFQGKRSNPELV